MYDILISGMNVKKLYENYKKACKKFKNDIENCDENFQQLNNNFYTNRGFGSDWYGSCDNAEEGFCLKWVFEYKKLQLSDNVIQEEFAKELQIFLKCFVENIEL